MFHVYISYFFFFSCCCCCVHDCYSMSDWLYPGLKRRNTLCRSTNITRTVLRKKRKKEMVYNMEYKNLHLLLLAATVCNIHFLSLLISSPLPLLLLQINVGQETSILSIETERYSSRLFV